MNACAAIGEREQSEDSRLTTAEVARLLRCNEAYVRVLADKGRLGYVERVPIGHGRTMRLFDPDAVEDYRRSRQ